MPSGTPTTLVSSFHFAAKAIGGFIRAASRRTASKSGGHRVHEGSVQRDPPPRPVVRSILIDADDCVYQIWREERADAVATVQRDLPRASRKAPPVKVSDDVGDKFLHVIRLGARVASVSLEEGLARLRERREARAAQVLHAREKLSASRIQLKPAARVDRNDLGCKELVEAEVRDLHHD